MPRNATTGVFTLLENANYPAVSGTKITSSAHNAQLEDLESALNTDPWSTLVVDARQYDLVVDDETAAAANSTALQAAMTAAAGKTLVLPAGTIWITAATGYACVTAPTAGIRIVGQGCFNTILMVPTLTGACHIAAVDADKFEIEGVGFSSGATDTTTWQRALVMRGVQRVSINKCWFYQVGGPAITFGTEGLHGTDHIANGTRRSERLSVTNNLLEDCYGTVAIITKYNGASDMIVSDNIIINSCATAISLESEDNLSYTTYDFWLERATVTGNIIYLSDYQNVSSPVTDPSFGIVVSEKCRFVTVSGNVIDTVTGNTTAAGISISTSPTQTDETVQAVSIVGNVINGVTAVTGRGQAIQVSVGDTSIDALTISGNTGYGGKVGITLITASGSKTLGNIRSLNINGNTLRGCSEIGIWCDATSGSGELAIRSAVIGNNSTSYCGSHGISVLLTNSAVTGNTSFANGGSGIVMSNGSKQNAITGNNVRDNGSSGITGDFTNSMVTGNVAVRNGQTDASGYGIRSTAGSGESIFGNRCSDDGVAGLAIGSNTARVSNVAFNYYAGGVEYSMAANPTGTAPGSSTIPSGTYGAVAFDAGTDGVFYAVEASANATGYASAALAIAGLPSVSANRVRVGWITVTRSGSSFVLGTTALNDGTTTTAYTSAIQDYGIRTASNGQTVRNNELIGNGLATIFGGIGNQNTGTYDAGLNRTA